MVSLLKWHTVESRAENENVRQLFEQNLKAKAFRACAAHLKLATAEKRGATNLAQVLERVTYRTTLRRLVDFDRLFAQLTKEKKDNDEVADWPRHLKVQIIACQFSQKTRAGKVFRALKESCLEKKDHLTTLNACIKAFLLRKSFQNLQRVPLVISRNASSFQRRQLRQAFSLWK